MNPRTKYGIDAAAEAEGIVVEFDSMRFRVRSTLANNRGYRYALGTAAAKRRPAFDAGGIDAWVAHEESLLEAFAETVVLGWEGVDGDDGQPLPFNRDACIALMRDCPAIWDAVRAAALDEERFRPVREDGDRLGKS